MRPLPLTPVIVDEQEARWLQLARTGDGDAFRQLVDRHQGRVARTVLGMLGEQDADDVAQEVFIRLHRHMHEFRGEAKLGTWLTRVAINLCLDRLRARQRRQWRWLSLHSEEGQRLEPALDGEALLDARERQALVRRAVQELKPEWRAVVVLRWLEGLSTEETADLLQLPYGTVLSRLSRAMKALGRELAPLLKAAPVQREGMGGERA